MKDPPLAYVIIYDAIDDDPDYFAKAELNERVNHFKVKPGDVVIDVGAERGLWTLQACAAGADKVIAFEPDKDNYYKLCRNVYINGYADRCVPVNIALMDGSYINSKYYKLGKTAGSFLVMDEEAVKTGGIDMITTTLDVFLAGTFRQKPLEKIDWIKIDVDGAEMECLHGMKETLLKYNPTVYTEIHINYLPELESRVRDFMAEIGYTDEEVTFHKPNYGRNCIYRKKG